MRCSSFALSRKRMPAAPSVGVVATFVLVWFTAHTARHLGLVVLMRRILDARTLSGGGSPR